MSLPKRKRKAPDIVSGIPFDKRESVNFITVSKQKRRVAVTSTQISVPITSLFHTEGPTRSLPPSDTAEFDVGVYSDTEEAATSPTKQTADRKGPSRSVSVSPFFFGTLVFCLLISTTDKDGRVVGTHRRIKRRDHQA